MLLESVSTLVLELSSHNCSISGFLVSGIFSDSSGYCCSGSGSRVGVMWWLFRRKFLPSGVTISNDRGVSHFLRTVAGFHMPSSLNRITSFGYIAFWEALLLS